MLWCGKRGDAPMAQHASQCIRRPRDSGALQRDAEHATQTIQRYADFARGGLTVPLAMQEVQREGNSIVFVGGLDDDAPGFVFELGRVLVEPVELFNAEARFSVNPIGKVGADVLAYSGPFLSLADALAHGVVHASGRNFGLVLESATLPETCTVALLGRLRTGVL